MIDNAKIVNHGMINIPAAIRKKLQLKDGDKVWVELNDEGIIQIIPIKSIEEIRKNSYSSQEMLDEMEKFRQQELEREK
jgi:AbrB family looped-hinge helix DNA binding protein